MGRFVLVTGGARSGKSVVAENRLRELEPAGPWLYVATAEPLDGEMSERIARHRARRGQGWVTVEAPRHPAQALSGAALVDCVTLFVTNLLVQGLDDGPILTAVGELAESARRAPGPVVIVTNEVGAGIVPENPLARRFRDLAGLSNQRLAAAADEVWLVAAGIPLRLK